MGPHKRVIFFGVTGICKNDVAKNVQEFIKSEYNEEYTIVHFEKDFLTKRPNFRSFDSYLAKPVAEQAIMWSEAWQDFQKFLSTIHNKKILLLLHGVFVRKNFGVRSVLDLAQIIKDFQPTLVVNLIDDIYSLYNNTYDRAIKGQSNQKPTLEQLLTGRKAELLISELLCLQGNQRFRIRHVLFSVRNPLRSLVNIIYSNAHIIYLSFPISAPRGAIKKRGDYTLKEGIDQFHKSSLDLLRDNKSISIISPLSIDELPFVETLTSPQGEGALTISFDSSKRWQLSDIWGEEATASNNQPAPAEIPIESVKESVGLISTDVGWRDFRLVSQSSCLAVYCPVPPGEDRITRGVRNEIDSAVFEGIPSYVFQDSTWDPNSKIMDIIGETGSMDFNHFHTWVTKVDTVTDLFDTVSNKISTMESR